MADEEQNEDAFEEDTQLEAAADALEAEENEQPGWWRWRKAAALVTFGGKKADEPPPPPVEPVSSVRGTKPDFWKLAKAAQKIKSIPPSPKTILPAHRSRTAEGPRGPHPHLLGHDLCVSGHEGEEGRR